MANKKTFLTESNFSDVKVTGHKGKDLYIQGIFAQADIVNQNNRMYPMEIMKPQIDHYIKEYVNQSRACGELNHPDSPTINPERISHIITKMWQEGSDFYGKAKVLNTPCGNILRGLVEGGVKVGVSTRATGSLETNNEGVDVVGDDFSLACVDVVFTPSAPAAFVEGIVEGRAWVWENGKLLEKPLTIAKKKILTTPSKKLEEEYLNIFKTFMKGLVQKG